MSHYVDKMFSVREAPWHFRETGPDGRTLILADYPGREEAMRAAGHDFEVVERPVFVGTETGPVWDEGRWKALVRLDTGGVLDVADSTYQVVQNGVGWDVVDALVAEPNVRYETAGVLKGGAVCWVLAWLDEPGEIPGDPSPVLPFVMTSWSHNGTSSLKAVTTDVRVVCWNTYSAASVAAERQGREFIFRHTARVMGRIAEAQGALGLARERHEAFMALATDLAGRPATRRTWDAFLVDFIPMPADALVSDRVKHNVLADREKFREILTSPSIEPIAGNRWGMFQAGIEWIDYGRQARSPETLFGRTMLRPEPAKAKLLSLVRSA